MYYLRTRAAADAIKFTVDQQALAANKQPAAAQQQLMSPSRAVQQQQQMLKSAQQSPMKLQAQQQLGGDDGLSMEEREAQLAKMICCLENKDACLMCGS